MPFLLTIHLFHLCWRSPEFCFSHKCFYHKKNLQWHLHPSFKFWDKFATGAMAHWTAPVTENVWKSQSIQTRRFSNTNSWSSNASISSWIHFVIPEIIDQDFYLSLKRYTKFVDCIISHFCLRFQALKPRENEVI